jgi:hypothetical protein
LSLLKGGPNNDFFAIHYAYIFFRDLIGVKIATATVVWTPIVWDSVENQVFDVCLFTSVVEPDLAPQVSRTFAGSGIG